MGLIETLALVFGIVVGAIGVPLYIYTVGPMIPLIRGILVALLGYASMFGKGPSKLVQTENDDYELRPVDSFGPNDHVYRLWGTNVAIAPEHTEAAWQELVSDLDFEALEDHDTSDLQDGYADAGMNRGSGNWYVDLRNDARAQMLIPLGEKLSELRQGRGGDMGLQSIAEALKDYGGDTAGTQAIWIKLAGPFLFLITGAGMGYVVFF
jgi:hypothetical protein